MSSAASPVARDSRRAERRIARLTLILGFVAALPVAVWISWRSGAGVLVGALLAWVNFRWLQQGLDALVKLATAQQGVAAPRISVWVYVKLLARYALIALMAYVIVSAFEVPVLSIVGGLCALGAAAVAGSIYELVAKSD